MRTVTTTALLCGLAACSVWEQSDRAAAYTFSNQCNEDLLLAPAGTGEAVSLPVGASHTIRTVDQEPVQTFVVSRADGSHPLQIAVGMSQVALEGELCPSPRSPSA